MLETPDDARPTSSTTHADLSNAPAWRRNRRWILLLLSVWAALTFLPAWFARDVPYTVLGWPLSYWMAAYGAPLAYLLIVVVYARVMNRGDDAWDE